MPCGCNSICPNNCSANSTTCIGFVPACSNSYAFTGIASGTIISSTHLAQLEAAINAERTNVSRRFIATLPSFGCSAFTSVACPTNAFSSFSFSGARSSGDVIAATHFNNVKTANNQVTTQSGFGVSVANNFIAGDIIYASFIQDLQTKINQTRNVCICDSHCSCNPFNCGCNGECPGDDPYY